jgi:hypothetical protein
MVFGMAEGFWYSGIVRDGMPENAKPQPVSFNRAFVVVCLPPDYFWGFIIFTSLHS